MQQLYYGLKDGSLVNIKDVQNGLDCGCVCPSCSSKLIAVQGKQKQWHFRHYDTQDCNKGQETAIHLLTKKLLSELNEIYIPYDYKEGGKLFPFSEVIIEQNYNEHLRPDVTVKNGNDLVFVEIAVTHFIDEEKLSWIENADIDTVEIDLSEYINDITYEPDKIKKLLLSGEKTKRIYSKNTPDKLIHTSLYDVQLPICKDEIDYTQTRYTYCPLLCEYLAIDFPHHDDFDWYCSKSSNNKPDIYSSKEKILEYAKSGPYHSCFICPYALISSSLVYGCTYRTAELLKHKEDYDGMIIKKSDQGYLVYIILTKDGKYFHYASGSITEPLRHIGSKEELLEIKWEKNPLEVYRNKLNAKYKLYTIPEIFKSNPRCVSMVVLNTKSLQQMYVTKVNNIIMGAYIDHTYTRTNLFKLNYPYAKQWYPMYLMRTKEKYALTTVTNLQELYAYITLTREDEV